MLKMKINSNTMRSFTSKFCYMALTLCLAVTACNEKELLYPQPETSLDASLVFDSPTRVLAQVNGMYSSLKHGNFLGGRYPMLNDIRGEDFLNRLNNIFT